MRKQKRLKYFEKSNCSFYLNRDAYSKVDTCQEAFSPLMGHKENNNKSNFSMISSSSL